MHNHHQVDAKPAKGRPVVLVGQPNVGKSALFSRFTGHRVDVSNYPGTTVEVARGSIAFDGQELTLIDTPGIQSLLPRSQDERVARDVLLQEHPWMVIQVADMKNLRRALLLTLQLAEHDIPTVMALNMADEAERLGIQVDTQRLSQILGTEVIPTVATSGEGLEALQRSMASPQAISYQIRYDGAIEGAIERMEPLLPSEWHGRRAFALALLAGDTSLQAELYALSASDQASLARIVAEVASLYDKPLGYVITQQRLRCADCLLAQVWQAPVRRAERANERLDRLMVHPVWGWPVLLFALALMYLFVGHLGAGIMVDWMESIFFGQWINPAVTRLVSLIPIPLVQDALVGEYGLVTMGLSYSVAIVLPIVLTFFLGFSVLEDSGYLARLAVMANRPFKAMGLNGKAVLPMVLGLGCDTMATLTTRILETRKERVQVTLLLALGVPCSAQLGVLMGMVAILTGPAILLWLGIMMITLFAVGWLAARVLPGQQSDFILELPPVRRPQLAAIVVKTVARVEWYLREVLPLFLMGTAILFVLHAVGVLHWLEQVARPVVAGVLGLPAETAGVFLIGFLRRDFGAAGLFDMAREGLLSTNQLVISLVVITLFVPCIANVLMIAREHGRRTAFWMTAFVFPFAFAVGGLLNLALRLLGIEL